jgi:hypothetical protein
VYAVLGVVWAIRRHLAIALVMGITALSVAGSHGVPALEGADTSHGAIPLEELAAVCLGITVIAAVKVGLPGSPLAFFRPLKGGGNPTATLPPGRALTPAARAGPVVLEVLRL